MKIGFPYPLARNFPHLLLLILALSTLRAEAIERWEVLPPTPKPIRSEHSGQANANGISIGSRLVTPSESGWANE
jgi:hypothetical protein